MATGLYSSEAEVLRVALESLEEEDESAALEAAIDDWQNGDQGIPLAEAFEQLRQQALKESSP